MVVVAISGQPGGGKTTVAAEVARLLGVPLVSSGAIFRELAAKYGMEFIQFHKYAETNAEIDHSVDSITVERAKRGNVVLEGHLAAWLARPYADVCVFLKADREIRARRVALRDGRNYEEALREIETREELNWKRYLAMYNIDTRDLSIFNLVLDTSHLSINDAVRITTDYVCTYLATKYGRSICFNIA